MDEVLQKWQEICKERQYKKGSKMQWATFIGALGEAYYLKTATQKSQEIEQFIEVVNKEEKFVSKLEGVNDKEFINTCIKAGIYKMQFIQSIKPIYEEETINQDRKEEKILKEFVFQNSDDLYVLEKIMGLSFVLEKSIEEIVEKISMYEEDMVDTYDCWSDEENEDFE